MGAVSGSEPERFDALGVGDVLGLMRLRSGGRESVLEKELEMDFWSALVRVSVSRANASETQESVKLE